MDVALRARTLLDIVWFVYVEREKDEGSRTPSGARDMGQARWAAR